VNRLESGVIWIVDGLPTLADTPSNLNPDILAPFAAVLKFGPAVAMVKAATN
jgi:hypothetical protein